MLHYLYGFGYGKDRQGGERKDKSLNFNINVGILAGKYLASNLAAEAIYALDRQIAIASRPVWKQSENGDVAPLFDLIKVRTSVEGENVRARPKSRSYSAAPRPSASRRL